MSSTSPVSHESIARRAHQLWEEAGHPDGSHTTHWLQAEQELQDSGAKPAGTPVSAKPVPPKVPHSTNYDHPGITTDALHHRRH